MADPRRADAPPAVVLDPAERDSRAEALLVEGLDHYFAGRYDEAIHLWTRVLFLDRAHPRARAYIDRARTAMAERQRQADQLIAETAELLDRGRTGAARDRFEDARLVSSEDETLSAIRMRLERQEQLERGVRRASRPATTPGERIATPALAPRWAREARVVAAIGGAAAMLVLVSLLAAPALERWLDWQDRADRTLTTAASQPWPVLTSGEVALVRARTLFNAGRLAEALRELDRVSRDSPNRSEADAFRAQIQGMLLAGGPERFRQKADR